MWRRTYERLCQEAADAEGRAEALLWGEAAAIVERARERGLLGEVEDEADWPWAEDLA